MKRNLLLTIFFCFVFNINPVSSQVPQYTLEANNFISDGNSFVTFDLVFTHTDATPMELAGWQFFFKVPQSFGVIGTGTGLNSSFYYDSTGGDAVSDLPVGFRPRNPQAVVPANAPGNYELRLAANSLPGCGNGLLIPQDVPTLIGRYKIVTTGGMNLANFNFIFRDSCESPLSVTRTKINWYDANDCLNKEMTRCASHNTTIFFQFFPYPNFTSNYQNISPGQSINFTDQSLNSPNQWLWSFPGGNPSSSTLQNPTGIVYSNSGNYDVTLHVSNPFGSNTLTKTNFIQVNNSCPITWQSFIKASDAGNVKDSLKFGMSPQATDLPDTCLGEEIIPPPPPLGLFDQRFILSNNDAVKVDFRNDTVSTAIWKMNFQPSVSGYPITFTWKNSDFPVNGSFFLKDATGLIVNINMRNQNSYVLTSSAINSLQMIYTFNKTMNIPVLNGWNIVSVPLALPNMNVTSIFPNAASPAYTYNNGYEVRTALLTGRGYWLMFNSAGNYSVTGLPVNPPNIPVNTSWNIIGPFTEDIPIENILSVPSGLISSNFFGFDDGYFIEDTLKSGRGYWIRSSGSGYLKNGSSDKIFLTEESTGNDLITFSFSNTAEKNIDLFLSSNFSNIENAYLPPVPPIGIFDVRYSSGKFIEDLSQNQTVQISSTERPLKLKVSNLNGQRIRIKDNINGNFLNKILEENEEITLNSLLDNFLIINESNIPKDYSVSQNYPNPFNPSTKIKYQIPAEGNVKIKIYDVLGKEVLELVNKNQQAGSYEAEFNGADFSSGIYFYRFEAGDFTELKRMILLK
ncbi:MAG: T9SS type A sorting domain-containing protein [Ignavibacteria bacterium]